MQQEDDLRALAKIMEFGRAVSIFILVVHVYVYCYPSMSAWHLNLDVIDRILMNFDRTTGIFGCILWTKLMAVLLLAISCMGTIGVKGEKITWQRIWAVLTAGAVLFFMNWWLLELPFPHEAITALYVVTLAAGYLCLLMAGLWISRLYRHNLMEDGMSAWHLNLDVIDRILMNFDRTTGIFGCILWTKLMAVLLLAISCMGTIGVKGEKITWQRIWAVLTAGAVLFFMNWWLLELPFPHEAITALYVVTLAAGYLCLLMAGLWISRLYRHNLMEDVFNMENESFMQETRLMENEYSVNLPTRFQYGGKLNDGWINVVNPFRATIVLGTPGSGKSYAVVNNYIKQMISKGFSTYIYGAPVKAIS